MSNPVEGKMKAIQTPESVRAKALTASILEQHKRLEQTPDQAVEAANDSHALKPEDKLAKMFGTTKAKALRRGAKTREDILRRKLPDF